MHPSSGSGPPPPPLRQALRLIVLTDRKSAIPRSVEEVVAESLRGGCRAIQLRWKEAGGEELLRMGQRLRALTAAAGALLFINDRVDVALAVGADGVHIGPSDLPLKAVRAIVPPSFLIGVSTDDPEEARRAEAEGANYIGCGAVHPTRSKADAGSAVGIAGVARVVEAVSLPVVGIGGVDIETAVALASIGAAGSAVISAVMGAEDPRKATEALLAPFEG